MPFPSHRSPIPPGPPLATLLAVCLAAAVFAHCRPGPPDHPAAKAAEAAPMRDARRAPPPRPEDVWLDGVGSGAAQLARACGRGASDRIAQALCSQPTPVIGGIDDLYRALGLVGDDERSVAGTTQSLGLSARLVSAANPRTFVFVNTHHYQTPIPYEKLAVVTFARGEQLVEMAALDTATFDWNFYLLRFSQACNASHCTPSQLLTREVERDWASWTLYADTDLQDTPLDCLSCHGQLGGGAHKLLLMRELSDPWLHWGDFRGVDENANCSQNANPPSPGRHVGGAGLDVLAALEGPGGKYAGIPVTELNAAKSGRDFAMFLVDAENTIRQSPYRPSDYPYEQLELGSARVLCERLATGTSTTWDAYREQMTSRGLPVAYWGTDVLDAAQRAALLADRAGLLARHADDDAADVARSWLGAEVERASGFFPREQDTALEVLRQMCVRCHDANAPIGSRRSLFDATDVEHVPPLLADEIRSRIHLPRHSPQLMPPLRAGELTASAIARIDAYLAEHGGEPQAGARD